MTSSYRSSTSRKVRTNDGDGITRCSASLHTTETHGYVERLRFPTEFQVGEDVIGQHRPLWARGAAVDVQDHDLLQIEIVGFSMLTDNQREGIQFANGIRRYLDSPDNEPAEPGPHRQGFRFAKRITTHIDAEPPVEGFEPRRSSTEGMQLPPEEKHPAPEEEQAQMHRHDDPPG